MKKFFKKFKALVRAQFLKLQGTWADDLLWCPSQCYFIFQYKGVVYCTYLRWRGGNPWTADVIKHYQAFGINPDENWISLPINHYTDMELPECKEEALEITKLYLTGFFDDDIIEGQVPGWYHILPEPKEVGTGWAKQWDAETPPFTMGEKGEEIRRKNNE